MISCVWKLLNRNSIQFIEASFLHVYLLKYWIFSSLFSPLRLDSPPNPKGYGFTLNLTMWAEEGSYL